MTVYVSKGADGTISLRARAVSDTAGGMVGDFNATLRPGESALGLTYDQWLATGLGAVDLDTAKRNS